MTALELDQLGTQAAPGNAAGPLGIDEAILVADDVGPPYGRELIQLTREGVRRPRLGSQTVDRPSGRVLVAIRIEDLVSKIGVDPPSAAVLVLFDAALISRKQIPGPAAGAGRRRQTGRARALEAGTRPRFSR